MSKIDNNAPEILYYVLFNKVMCAFEQGNACSSRILTF